MSEKTVGNLVELLTINPPPSEEADGFPEWTDPHAPFTSKKVCEMDICPRARVYMQSLVDAGEWIDNGCEQCVIEFVCDDPLEHCMNPEDEIQWVEQCVRDRGFWQIWARIAYTQDYALANEHHIAYYKALKASVERVMAKHGLELVIQ